MPHPPWRRQSPARSLLSGAGRRVWFLVERHVAISGRGRGRDRALPIRILAKDELDRFCRRYLIPYIDMGMDVHEICGQYLIAGQVVLTTPGAPCLRCMGIVTDELLTQEARKYRAAGGKPQVIWPNGVLASTAVGLLMRLICPWHAKTSTSAYLEYDGNKHTITPSKSFSLIQKHPCPHYYPEESGDAIFDIRYSIFEYRRR